MPDYLRPRVSGSTIFFTVNLADRESDLLTREIDRLRDAILTTFAKHPCYLDAIVILPDHLHAVWTLPSDDSRYSARWGKIKSLFVRGLPSGKLRPSHHRRQEKGIWQRRFWEHHIRDAADYRDHVEYCWINPVKHRLVERAVDWPHSSIHRDIRLGRADPGWSIPIPDGDFGE